MKQVVYKTFFLIMVAFSMAVMANAVLAQIYKTVDENGNVTYTDRPPEDGSAPIKLPPISVIETPVYEPPARVDKNGADSKDGQELSLRELRKFYADFAIVAPQQEESIWHPEKAMTVAWSTLNQLKEGMQVAIYIDGKLQSKTTERTIAVPQLDRGEHKVEAQLTDAKNRGIATAEPVIFFIKRPNLYTNRPRPRG